MGWFSTRRRRLESPRGARGAATRCRSRERSSLVMTKDASRLSNHALRSLRSLSACVTGRASLSRARGARRRERRASRSRPRPFSPPGTARWKAGSWWTERASGARSLPDDASTAGRRPRSAASPGGSSAARAFEVCTSSQTLTRTYVPYAACTERYMRVGNKPCKLLYDTFEREHQTLVSSEPLSSSLIRAMWSRSHKVVDFQSR